MSERDAMLDFDWGNQSAAVMFPGDDETAAADNSVQNRQFFDPYTANQHNFDGGSLVGPNAHFGAGADHLQLFHHQEQSVLYDPRAYGIGVGGVCFPHPSQVVPLLSMETAGGPPPEGFVVVPKSEPLGGGGGGVDFSGANLGLNLGVRTYFSSSSAAEDDFVNRLYRRSRAVETGFFNTPRCQAEGCNADLTHAKHYYRRHKVCEFHSKAAATVVAGGLTQRFCQQCSRFHVLTEFDNGKRSCRRRLADHNRRRRKNPQPPNRESGGGINNTTHLLDNNAHNSSSDNSLARSPSDSGSVTVAVSPPTMSIDCFGRRSYDYQLQENQPHSSSHMADF